VAVNDTFFFTAQGTWQGRNIVHTLHFRQGTVTPVLDPAQELINAWQAACQVAWLGIHPPTYSLVRLTAQRICGSLPLPSRVEEGVGLAGTRTVSTDILPPWMAIAVNESTGRAGRRWHGRFFLTGGEEADVQQENFVAGASAWLGRAQAYVTALGTTFIGDVTTKPWVLVVHSRKEFDTTPGAQCQDTSSAVTSLGIVSRLTTQRSRRA
jgi:hypothetical protein